MIFVHAGIRPGFPIEAQDAEDLMWIRDEFLWQLNDHEALIVHGHTPVEAPTHYGNRVNIDTGAGWGRALVPVVFEGGVCHALMMEERFAQDVGLLWEGGGLETEFGGDQACDLYNVYQSSRPEPTPFCDGNRRPTIADCSPELTFVKCTP